MNKTLAFLLQRKRAYQTVFGKADPAVSAVLTDLAKFCRAHTSCFHEDPRIHAALEGRREVFLRIVEHLGLSAEELYVKYGGLSARKEISNNE